MNCDIENHVAGHGDEDDINGYAPSDDDLEPNEHFEDSRDRIKESLDAMDYFLGRLKGSSLAKEQAE